MAADGLCDFAHNSLEGVRFGADGIIYRTIATRTASDGEIGKIFDVARLHAAIADVRNGSIAAANDGIQ